MIETQHNIEIQCQKLKLQIIRKVTPGYGTKVVSQNSLDLLKENMREMIHFVKVMNFTL